LKAGTEGTDRKVIKWALPSEPLALGFEVTPAAERAMATKCPGPGKVIL
jgi:hypothetical protein